MLAEQGFRMGEDLQWKGSGWSWGLRWLGSRRMTIDHCVWAWRYGCRARGYRKLETLVELQEAMYQDLVRWASFA